MKKTTCICKLLLLLSSWVLVAMCGSVAFSQAVVPVYDLGTNASGTVISPLPGPNDITNFNNTPNTDYQQPDGLNYYEDNGGALDPGGQTFTAPPTNCVLNAVALEMGLDSGDAAGYGGTGPGTFWLRIYSVSGTTATLLASYISSNTFSFTAGDWLQWTNLGVALSANGLYAYSFARDVNTPGWCQLYAANGNSYSGGQICLIQAAGGAGSVTYGTAGTWDANFDIGIGPLTLPVATPPAFNPASPVYAGTPVTASEVAGGIPPLAYQWQTDGGSGGALTNIPGATSTNILLTLTNIGTYVFDCIVTNNSGATTSLVASLVVNPPLAPQSSTNLITPSTNIFAYANGEVTMNASFYGTLPISYQWQDDTNNGGYVNIGGATNITLGLTNMQLTASGNYQIVATNNDGTSNVVAALTVLSDPPAPTPSQPYAYAVYSLNPVGYWRLNENHDPSIDSVQAYDYSGNNHDATYGHGALNGVQGPQSPAFGGFEANNTAAYTLNPNGVQSYISVPPSLNLNTNTVTITAWINPVSLDNTYWGLVMWRGTNGDAGGLSLGGTLSGTMAELGYVWNSNSPATWGYNSGLYAPMGSGASSPVWSFVALVITPTNSSIYLCNVSGGTTNILKSVQAITNMPESFNGGTINIASDNYDGRDWNGSIGEVAIFAKSLSESQIDGLFFTALGGGVTGLAPTITVQPVATVIGFAGPAVSLSVQGGGAPYPSFKWQSSPNNNGPWTDLHDGGRISGSATETLTFNSTLNSDAIYYQAVLANSFGSVTSSVANLNLVATPTNGVWTVNFAIVNGYNGLPATPYSGRGILGTGTTWNALQTGATIPGRSLFMTGPAPVVLDDGVTVSPISVVLNDYNWGWGDGPSGSIGLLGSYEEIGDGNFNGAPTDLIFSQVPNGTYNLALYGVDGGYGNQGDIFTVNGQVQSTTGGAINEFIPAVNTVLYTNVLVTNGTLDVNCTNNTAANPSQTSGAFNGAQLQLVQAVGNPSRITTVAISGGNVNISGTSYDAGQGYHIVTATNILTPIINWTPVASGTFGAAGFSNNIPITPGEAARFYRVTEP